MQQPPARQRTSGTLASAGAFEAKQDEQGVLDSMLVSLSRGAVATEAWDKLHAEAVRNARLAELAFAFQSVASGNRLKAAQPAAAAEFLFQAARYTEDVFGDGAKALEYLERALAVAPSHSGALERIERLLERDAELSKLGELYATIAQHRTRGEQGPMLRRAADLLMRAGDGSGRAMELLQQVLRLQPRDDDTRALLEQLYVSANRVRDAVRLNEQAMSADPPPDNARRRKLLARVVDLYESKLSEPERALPHVEQLLALEPTHEGARRVAQRLLGVKGLVGRAASALAVAAENFGAPHEVAHYIGIELEHTRGPKRANVLLRLARLKHDLMGDDASAFDALEQAIGIDPSDDEARQRYVDLAGKLQRWADAAKLLARVIPNVKEPATKAVASAQLGELMFHAGDVKRAKAMLAGVLTDAAAPPEAVLTSARRLRGIFEREGNLSALSDVLQKVAALESDSDARREADEALAESAIKLGDLPRAIAAYERLLSTPARARSLLALPALYETIGDAQNHARSLEQSASETADETQARAQLLRAAQVRVNTTEDTDAAVRTCEGLIERFGPTNEVLTMLMPLLAKQRRWADLAAAFARQASLTVGSEHAKIMARLGALRIAKLGDAQGAIDAFAKALAFDPSEKNARMGLEKLAASGDHRLAAARVLEPMVRREEGGVALLELLELRGCLAPELDERLAALREYADVAAALGASGRAKAEAAIEQGLVEVVAAGGPVQEWVDRLDRIPGPAADARVAAIFAGALGDREITSDHLSLLAKRAAEAHVACGHLPAAITLYRRALGYEPYSPDLLSRIDDLLRQQGTPAERVALYRDALPGGDVAQRKDVLFRIAAIERLELQDADAAIATYRLALEDDAGDVEASERLAELFAEGKRWPELSGLLENRLAHVQDDGAHACAIRAKLVEVSKVNGDERLAREQCARLLDDTHLAPEHLLALEGAANWLGDLHLLRAVFQRGAELGQDARERIAWLDRLGKLSQDQIGDKEAAAAAWKRAAALAETAADEATARGLYRRAQNAVQDDEETIGRLTVLCERAESWAELPALYLWLAKHAKEDAHRADHWLRRATIFCEKLGDWREGARSAAWAFELRPTSIEALTAFEKMSTAAGAAEDFVRAVDDALARLEGVAPCDPALRAVLLLAKARGLASDPTYADDAARLYRTILEDATIERARQFEALRGLEALVGQAPNSPPRRADRRWALEWHAQHATQEEQVESLIAWAAEEETVFVDPAQALVLYRRALVLDPANGEALSSVARLALLTGQIDEALSALQTRRDQLKGREQRVIDLEIVQLEVSRTARWTEPESWCRAEEIARALSRPHEVAALYEEVLARPLAGDQASWLGERAVQFYEEWFDDSSRLVIVLDRVLELNGEAEWAFERLRLVFDAEERWDDLFALYDRALKTAAGKRRITLLEDVAQAAKDFARRPEVAIRYLEQLRELKPDHAKVVSALERLYERQGRHQDLVSLLTERLPFLEGEDARCARMRIADLCLDHLNDATAALNALEPLPLPIAETPPGNLGPAEAVRNLLERVLAATPVSHGQGSSATPGAREHAPSARERAAAWLCQHYARAGQEVDLARLLLIDLETIESPRERSRQHARVADLYERLGEYANALEQTGACLVLDPRDEDRRAKLAELGERSGRLDRLAELLVAAAEKSQDERLRIALTMDAAAVRADRIGDTPGAIALFSSVLSMSNLGDADALCAARRLESLLEVADRSAEQLDVSERIADIESEPRARNEALGRAARLALRLGDERRAAGLWERRIAIDGGDREALDGLVTLLERSGNTERLIEVLALRARASQRREEQRADRVRGAALMSDALGRYEEAIALWQTIETDFGEASDSTLALVALLETTSRWEQLAGLLERTAERLPDEAMRAEGLRRLGDVRREQLGQNAAAVEAYARSLTMDSRNPGARAGLVALAQDAGQGRLAVDALLGILRGCDDWRAILELTPKRLASAESEKDKILILCEAAAIAENRAGDLQAAFQATRHAFVLAPGEEPVRRDVYRLAEATDAWSAMVDAYREAIDGPARGEPALVTELTSLLASVLETRLADSRGALTAYLEIVREARRLDAGHAAVRIAGQLGLWRVAAEVVLDLALTQEAATSELLDAYDQAASARAAWDDATRALAEVAASCKSSGLVIRDLEARVARWHRDQRGDHDAAQAAFQRALAHDEGNVVLLAELIELQRRSRGRPLVERLLQLSRATSGDVARLREAAEVTRESVGDRRLAIDILGELLDVVRARAGETEWSEDDGDQASCAEWALETLAQVHQEDGEWRAVVDLFGAENALPIGPDVRAGMRRRAARISLERLGDHERAIALYLALFDDDPKDHDAADRLAALYESLDRTSALVELRDRQIASSTEPDERLALRLGLSKLLFVAAQPERAVRVLRDNLQESPRHWASVEALASLLDDADRAPELAELLAERADLAEQAGEASKAVDLWSRAAALAEERLRDRLAAERYHMHVVGLEARRASVDALARLTMTRGDSAAAAVWLERLVDIGSDPEARVQTVLRLSDALVGAGKAARAVARLQQELGATPNAEALRDRLAALYRDSGDWEHLAETLADAGAHAADSSTRLKHLLEAAGLWFGRCGRADKAVPLLEQGHDLARDDLSIDLRLAEALTSMNRYEDAYAILQAVLGAFGTRRPKERAAVHYQCARLELTMGHRERALVELDVARRIDPQNPEILKALAELARDDGQLDQAERSYRALLLVLRRSDDVRPPVMARCEVLLELSAIARCEGDADRAGEILETALEAASQEEFEQERLEAALRARGDSTTLVRALEAKVGRLGDSPAGAKVLAEVIDLLVSLGSEDGLTAARIHKAVTRCESLCKANPANREVWEPLAAVYRRLGELGRLADLLSQVVDWVDDPIERTRIRWERARSMVHDLRIGDEEATPLLREILEENPGHLEAGHMLALVLERSGAKSDLIELLRCQIEAAKDRSDAEAVASLALRLGRLLQETDRDAALRLFYIGLDWVATNRDLLDGLIQVLETEADAGERADVLERRLALEQGPGAEEMAISLFAIRMAFGDRDAAHRALEMGLHSHPTSAELRARLEGMSISEAV
jgi:tetratricopeptide (TPR) repeat protein